MWFLVKAAIGFVLILLVLPFFSSAPQPASDHTRDIAIGATIEAAQSAIDDVTGICQRRPDVCKTGGEALSALGSQARDGALIAYRYLDTHFGSGSSGDPMMTGTVAERPAADDVAAQTRPAREPAAPVPATTVAAATPAAAKPALVGEAYLPHPYSPPQR